MPDPVGFRPKPRLRPSPISHLLLFVCFPPHINCCDGNGDDNSASRRILVPFTSNQSPAIVLLPVRQLQPYDTKDSATLCADVTNVETI